MCLGPNFTLHRNSAHQAGVAPIFDRILSELSVKMKRLNIDRAELTCLKAIILFNPGIFTFCILFSNNNLKLNFTQLILIFSFRYSGTKMQTGC